VIVIRYDEKLTLQVLWQPDVFSSGVHGHSSVAMGY